MCTEKKRRKEEEGEEEERKAKVGDGAYQESLFVFCREYSSGIGAGVCRRRESCRPGTGEGLGVCARRRWQRAMWWTDRAREGVRSGHRSEGSSSSGTEEKKDWEGIGRVPARCTVAKGSSLRRLAVGASAEQTARTGGGGGACLEGERRIQRDLTTEQHY